MKKYLSPEELEKLSIEFFRRMQSIIVGNPGFGEPKLAFNRDHLIINNKGFEIVPQTFNVIGEGEKGGKTQVLMIHPISRRARSEMEAMLKAHGYRVDKESSLGKTVTTKYYKEVNGVLRWVFVKFKRLS